MPFPIIIAVAFAVVSAGDYITSKTKKKNVKRDYNPVGLSGGGC